MPKKASDLSPDFRFMALFVGPKHAGKTCAADSFPTPINFLDFDGRIRGLLGAPWINRERITYDYFLPKEPNLVEKIDKLLVSQQIMANTPGMFDLQTQVLDSLTSETYAMLTQGIQTTHRPIGNEQSRGRFLGSVAMAGPEEYGYEAQTTYDILSALRTIPIPNVICTAHVVEKFGKENPDDKYSPTVVVGEKLSLRDKIGANIGIYFDHIFRFDRRMVGGFEKFYVKFRGDLACTSYAELPTGEHDITGKDFYKFMRSFFKEKTPLTTTN